MRWAVTASEHPSLRRAAQALNIRESTLSRRLRDLEYRLGVSLFERSANGTELTAAGEEFVVAAKHILAEVDVAFARTQTRGHGESGDLAVGVCTALSVGNLRATVAKYARRHHGVEVRSIDGSRAKLLAELVAGSIDVFLTAEGDSAWQGASMELWSERLMVALPASHSLCSRRLVRWVDFAGTRFLVNRGDPGPNYERMLREKLRECRCCTFIDQDVSLDRFLGLVGAGLGVTLVPESAAGASDPAVAYRELHDDDGPVRIRFAAYWKETNRNPALRPFLDLLRERYSDTAPALSSE